MIQFRLALFGSPTLCAPDGDLIRLRTRKHLGLLIYLVVEADRDHTRDALANLFWANGTTNDSHHSLATALLDLRSHLGADAVLAVGDNLQITPGRVITDLAELDRDDPADRSSRSYGPFLDGLDIGDAFDFQDWKDRRATHFASRIAGVVGRRIDDARRHCDLTRMDALADQLVAIDPYSEAAIRARMEARAMTGDRIGALRVFEQWRAHLVEQLGAVPSAVIDRLAERLRRNQWERPVIAGAAQPDSEWPARVFVGRHAEFATCYEIWEDVRRGRARHLLVRGDTGIGKTTLIDRLITTVSLEGGTVARVKCYELERELPFGVIGGLVNQLLDLPGAGATPPEHLAELGRLVLKVRQRYPSLPEPLPSVGESARILLTEAVAALVASVADEQPVVLVVDDIHVADTTSLAVLHVMLRRISAIPVLAVLTSSSAVHAETEETRRFVDHAAALGITQLELGALAPSEASQLLDTLVMRSDIPSAAVRRAVVAAGHGNPMVLELLMFDWHRCREDCFALSLGAMTSVARPPADDAFRRLIDRTLSALEPDALAVAELAAILGARLNDLSMYALIDFSPARTMRAMTSLASQRILRDAANSLEFTNEFVRGQCYVSIAATLRRILHGAVADRLLGDDAANRGIPGLEIAWHLVRADRLQEAVPYLLTGGREAIRRAAAREAGLALSTGLPALTGAPRRTAILLLAEAQQELGQWSDSLRLLNLASEPFDDSEECSREVFRMISRRWLGEMSLPEMRSATALLLGIAGRDIDIETRVKALSAAVRMLGLTRDKEHLTGLHKCAKMLCEKPMDTYPRLHLILSSAWSHGARHESREALRLVCEGVQLAEDSNVASSITFRLLIGKANLLYMLGQYGEARAPLFRALDLCNRLDNDSLAGECACQLAVVEGRLGRSDLQIRWARKALALLPPNEWCTYAISASYELGLGLVAENRTPEAVDAVEPLRSRKSSGLPVWVTQARLLCASDILALSGSTRRAYAAARTATSGTFANLHNIAFAGIFSRWTALVGIRDNEADDAHRRLLSAFPNIEHLDHKDQAEFLASVATLEDKLGIAAASRWDLVQERLQSLPQPIATVMRRLGTMPKAAQ